MSSVTQRIRQIKQPYGGYLKPSEFKKEIFIDSEILKEENIHSSLVGLTVDYLTRFMLNTSREESFKISILGSKIIGEEKKAYGLLNTIKGLDNNSIYSACKLVGYDVCYRQGAIGYRNIDEIEADVNTIDNIRIMVKRGIQFFDKFGPIIMDGFTFEGGYTQTINSGDGDFLTGDTLWDFKVSKNNPTSAHTLQLLIYYIMGVHSIHDEFKGIKKLGIFNPRINCIYLKSISDIPKEIFDEVETKVIEYRENNDNTPILNKETVLENEDLFSMEQIMKFLSCSQHIVMKYYFEKGLPLVKINNEYFINRYNLIEWLEKIDTRKRLKLGNIQIIDAIAIIFIIILLYVIFNNIYG